MMVFYYVLALFIIALDQLTKYAVVIYMDIGESIELIPDFLYLTSHRNEGAAFGILQGQMWFFYIITVVVVAAIIYHLHKYGKSSFMIGLPLVFILGGALGNFIDRVLFGAVVDFVDTYFWGYSYPIFNVADSALVVGVGLLIIKMMSDEWKEKRKNKHGSNAVDRNNR